MMVNHYLNHQNRYDYFYQMYQKNFFKQITKENADFRRIIRLTFCYNILTKSYAIYWNEIKFYPPSKKIDLPENLHEDRSHHENQK